MPFVIDTAARPTYVMRSDRPVPAVETGETGSAYIERNAEALGDLGFEDVAELVRGLHTMDAETLAAAVDRENAKRAKRRWVWTLRVPTPAQVAHVRDESRAGQGADRYRLGTWELWTLRYGVAGVRGDAECTTPPPEWREPSPGIAGDSVFATISTDARNELANAAAELVRVTEADRGNFG